MDQQLLEKVQDLNDIELTILASLISGNHCIVSTAQPDTFSLEHSLASLCQATFGIEAATLRCSRNTSIDELNDSLLLNRALSSTGARPSTDDRSIASFGLRRPTSSRLTSNDSLIEHRGIASVMIIANLDLADESVQAQVIELLRTKRMFTRNSMYTAPKDFLLIATLSQTGARLSYHLNDTIASSHLWTLDDQKLVAPADAPAFITQAETEHMRLQAGRVRLTAGVDTYLYNMVLHMRMSRYVQGGISATATRQMRALCKALATLHGIEFVTPSLVMLAARKIYPHRIILATAATEQSLQWGSDPVAIQRLLDCLDIAEVIEDVIASVKTPL